jgi:CysZ protein
MGFFAALAYPFRGCAFLARRRDLWRYAAWAFGLNLAALAALTTAFAFLAPTLTDLLTPDRGPGWLESVAGCLVWIVWIVALYFLATILGHLIAGPFLDAMTERILASLGEPLPPPRGIARAVGRAAANQGLKLLFFVGVQTLLLLLLLTPGAVVLPVLGPLATAFFLGSEALDYPLDARGLSVPARLRWLFARLGATLGYGAACFALSFVGFLALPALVAGAALFAHDLDPPASAR